MTQWRWKYFTRDELKCKGDGTFVANDDALDKLERLRELMGVPLTINSAYRSPAHNRKIGGADNSMHVQGRAFDISINGVNPKTLYRCAIQAGFTGFGFYRTFLHVDTGGMRSWGGYKQKYQSKINLTPLYDKADKPATKGSEDLIEASGAYSKDTENPHKIEGVKLSDKQKFAAVASASVVTTGVVGGGAVIAIAPQITSNNNLYPEPYNLNAILEHAPTALSFLQSADWRVAVAVIGVLVGSGAVWWWRRK